MGIVKEVHGLMDEVYKTLLSKEELLLTNDEYENDNDLIWELPRYATVNKWGYYQEYAITKITKGGDISAKGIGEDWGEEIAITTSDLSYGEAVVLLEYLED